ncbi:phage tail terminator family protein [Clostridium magnum]|uniref:Phage protein n=1 Tax=Clostridium magnum DSM 2767 TaxID=1121326 RepID=A0A161XI32_9CLOT|nr:hypothetical protein [Clostridium magnum]KZL94366.1 hypothetical protein CLMAG_14190 [Clostridium magnum DSM 2767]SHJ49791.1 hypothetical protein SAMN02745944_06061 [Clostridium magnum DSM 2767]
MITLVDIKKSINDVLKGTGYKVYGNEVKEGFTRPCFFAQLIPISSDILKKDTSENFLMAEIIYFSKDKTDLENLKMYDVLKKSFIPTLQVNNRKFLVRNFRSDTIDDTENDTDNIYSIRFDLNFYDEIIDNTPEAELMQNLSLKL